MISRIIARETPITLLNVMVEVKFFDTYTLIVLCYYCWSLRVYETIEKLIRFCQRTGAAV